MKKRINLMLTLILICIGMSVNGQEKTKGIVFEKEGTLFNDAVKKAKATNKLLFMDCYTSWCGPCKMMANTVFPQEKVGKFMNSKFVCLKVDMEKGEGPELGKKLQVNAYPTFIIFNAEGQELGRFLGGCQAEDFIKKVTEHSTDNGSAEMDKRFANGERSEEFLYAYLETLGNAYKKDQCNTVAEALLDGKAETFAQDKKLADVFMKHINNPFCPAFVYTAKHPEQLSATIGEMPVKMKLQSVWRNYSHSLINNANGQVSLDQTQMDKWLTLMDECNVNEKEELRLNTLIAYNEKKGDWNEYMKLCKEYADNPALDVNDLILCKWCTPIAEKCKEEAPRKAAVAMLQQRLDELNSGKRQPQTKMGNMTLAGNLKGAMEKLISVLNNPQ